MTASPSNSDNSDPCDEVRKKTRIYLMVGLILFIGTGTTVAVATVPWLDVGGHGFDRWDAMLGIGIASFKAMLVATIFMHLNHERALIYGFISLAAIHAIGFFVGTYLHFTDMTHDAFFYTPTPSSPSASAVSFPSS